MRLSLDDPFSRSAIWCRRLALLSLVVAALGLGLAHFGVIHAMSGLAIFSAALLLACFAGVLGFAALVVIWRTGKRGTGMVLGSLAMLGLLLGFPAFLVLQAIRLPAQNDASTDLVDPPDYSRSSVALAARGGHVKGDLPQAWREAQRKTWPDLQPLSVDLDMPEAWQLVQATVSALRWRVIEQQGDARLEAIDFTWLLGFPDDITIRLRPVGEQTRIDIRSSSRYGQHDFGVNARRIQTFAAQLQVQRAAK